MVKLIQGDCTIALRDIPSDSVDLVLTDPPYGIDFQSCRIEQKEYRIEWWEPGKSPFVGAD